MSQYWSATHILSVVMLLTCRSLILLKNYWNLSVWILKWNWTCFRNNLSCPQKRVFLLEKKETWNSSDYFLLTGLLERKKTYSWKKFKCHLVQDFTLKEWTLLTFNMIQKIPLSLLLIFNILSLSDDFPYAMS